MRARRILAGAAVVAVVLAAAAVIYGTSRPTVEIPQSLATRKPDIARGQYVAVLGDCTACHTAPGGKPFAGGLSFPTPIGTIYASNITPDRQTGIGRYTLSDFIRLMRLGVTPEGTRVYPAMPYTAFAKVSDEDLQDLFAFLQQRVAPIQEANRADTAPWPLSMRWPLAFWNVMFHDTSRYTPDPSKGDEWNRGAYLVQGFTHCGTCHTPRGFALQEKSVDGRSDVYLSGTQLVAGSPINLRSNDGDGLGRWRAEDLFDVLKSGRSRLAGVNGQMGEVVQHSTQYMTDSDVHAIVAYVKSLSPAPGEGRATFAADDSTLKTIMAGQEHSAGGRMYMDSCAACHRLSGSGENWAFPRLAGNSTVLSEDKSSLIAMIIGGGRLPATDDAKTGLAMPPFGWRYNDDQIAQLATFIRTSWGNHASAVTADQVSRVRKLLRTENPAKPVPKG